MRHLLWLIVLLISSCATATRSTSSSRCEINYETHIDSLRVFDTTSVRHEFRDSIHYVFNDHYRERTKMVYRDRTDTLLVRDTIVNTVVKNAPTTALLNTKDKFVFLFFLVVLGIALIRFR